MTAEIKLKFKSRQKYETWRSELSDRVRLALDSISEDKDYETNIAIVNCHDNAFCKMHKEYCKNGNNTVSDLISEYKRWDKQKEAFLCEAEKIFQTEPIMFVLYLQSSIYKICYEEAMYYATESGIVGVEFPESEIQKLTRINL